MNRVLKKAETQSFVQIPEFSSNAPQGGLESRRTIDQFNTLASALDAQANVLDEWREFTVELLLRPLVDEDDEVEITGEEYEQSTRTQDEVIVYVQALGAAIADRLDVLSGQENKRVQQEVRTTIQLARRGEGAFPEKTLELLNEREQIKPSKNLGSMRGIIAELRALVTSLRSDAESGKGRATVELTIVETQLALAQKEMSKQNTAAVALEKELETFRNLMNARLEFYRQLQQVSDTVTLYEGPNNDVTAIKMLNDEEKLEKRLAVLRSKHRYLVHLRQEATNPEEQRRCVICTETFEVGALTVCGHQFCKNCIGHWWTCELDLL